MNLINQTGTAAGYTVNMDPDGREYLVVVVKGTFAFPKAEADVPALAAGQAELVTTDESTGEPGLSAIRVENDFPLRKPRCDVLLSGSAYAPGGRPTDRVTVSLRVGGMQKGFDVVGTRVWQAGAFTLATSKPEPFARMPFGYDQAFGGVDRAKEDPATFRWYPTNFAGTGWHEYLDTKFLDGTPLPNTEETGAPVKKPNGTYKPMAFGPLGRAWQQRARWAGTYDQAWRDEQYPFLPKDFDERYYQASAADQWIEYPRGGEPVELLNLTPAGRTAFRLPIRPVTLEVFRRGGPREDLATVVDTLLFEPDLGRFQMTWRCSVRLRRGLNEVHTVVASAWAPGTAPVRTASGKLHYRSLAQLPVAAQPWAGK
jgi:hypothetical protein